MEGGGGYGANPGVCLARLLGARAHVRDAMIKTTSMIEMHRLRMTMTQQEQAMNSTFLTLTILLQLKYTRLRERLYM